HRAAAEEDPQLPGREGQPGCHRRPLGGGEAGPAGPQGDRRLGPRRLPEVQGPPPGLPRLPGGGRRGADSAGAHRHAVGIRLGPMRAVREADAWQLALQQWTGEGQPPSLVDFGMVRPGGPAAQLPWGAGAADALVDSARLAPYLDHTLLRPDATDEEIRRLAA